MKVKTTAWGDIEANPEMLENIATAFYEAAELHLERGQETIAKLEKETARNIEDELEKQGWYD